MASFYDSSQWDFAFCSHAIIVFTFVMALKCCFSYSYVCAVVQKEPKRWKICFHNFVKKSKNYWKVQLLSECRECQIVAKGSHTSVWYSSAWCSSYKSKLLLWGRSTKWEVTTCCYNSKYLSQVHFHNINCQLPDLPSTH
jgi:hypothetical protein